MKNIINLAKEKILGRGTIKTNEKIEEQVKNGPIKNEEIILSAKLEIGGQYDDVQGVVERIVPVYEDGVMVSAFYEGVVLEQDKEVINKALAKYNLARESDHRLNHNFDKRIFQKTISVQEFNKKRTAIAHVDGINPNLIYDLFKGNRSTPGHFELVSTFSNGFENIKNFTMDSDGIISVKKFDAATIQKLNADKVIG